MFQYALSAPLPPTTKSLWLCSSVYCGPPHESRRIWLAAEAANQKKGMPPNEIHEYKVKTLRWPEDPSVADGFLSHHRRFPSQRASDDDSASKPNRTCNLVLRPQWRTFMNFASIFLSTTVFPRVGSFRILFPKIKLSPLSVAYLRQWNGSTLVQ